MDPATTGSRREPGSTRGRSSSGFAEHVGDGYAPGFFVTGRGCRQTPEKMLVAVVRQEDHHATPDATIGIVSH
jgi:hypothetical protein